MFEYFCLDDWVPADHLLRSFDRQIDCRPLRTQLRPLYSDVGRPSIDPEVLLRILLIGYLYGITSERRLMDEVRLNLAYRWFTGLGFDQLIPDHSTLGNIRHFPMPRTCAYHFCRALDVAHVKDEMVEPIHTERHRRRILPTASKP